LSLLKISFCFAFKVWTHTWRETLSRLLIKTFGFNVCISYYIALFLSVTKKSLTANTYFYTTKRNIKMWLLE